MLLKMVNEIILANPRGFCAGVERAISIVEKALEIYGKPVYVRHHIVHNIHVVKELESKGAVFVEDINEIPDENIVILSAHGSAPNVKKEAEKKNLKVIDAACPLVSKIHFEATNFHKNDYEIVYIGHKGHQEAIGTMGHAPMHIIEKATEVDELVVQNPNKLVYLTQTTLSVDETKDIISKLKEKFPNIIAPPKEDICYATTNRQTAVKELAKKCDLIFVVGSKTSSNSNRLRDVAIANGCNSYLIDDYSKLDEKWMEDVKILGITSGASVPDNLVQELINFIKKNEEIKVTNLNSVKENMFFALPKELK